MYSHLGGQCHLTYGPVFTYVYSQQIWVHELINNSLTVCEQDRDRNYIETKFYELPDCRFLTGLMGLVYAACVRAGITVTVDGYPFPISLPAIDPKILATSAKPDFSLYSYQGEASQCMSQFGRGILRIGTGGGKTETYIATLKHLENLYQRPLRSLTLLDTTNLATQMEGRMKKYGLDSSIFKRGSWSGTHVVSVIDGLIASLQTGSAKIKDWLAGLDVLCYDETHHAPAETCYQVGIHCGAHFRWGLSATPFANAANPYSNARDMRLIGLLGPVLYHVPFSYLRDNGYVPNPEIRYIPVSEPRGYPRKAVWREKIPGRPSVERDLIVNNQYRNWLLCRVCFDRLSDPNTRIVILVALRDHGLILQQMLQSFGIDSVCSYGGKDSYSLDEYGNQYLWKDKDDDALKQFQSGQRRVLVGTQKFDEGQSFGNVTDVFLAQGGRGGVANRRLFQRVGRAAHSKIGKVRVWTFYDTTHPLLADQANECFNALNAEGYDVKILAN